MEEIKQKYLKYKKKYLQLKQIGGQYCHTAYTFGNTIGSCWYVSLLMIFLFGDYYRDRILDSFKNLENTIKSVVSQPELRGCLPDIYFTDGDYTKGLTHVTYDIVFNFLNTIKIRFENKIIQNKIYYRGGIELRADPPLIRAKSILCEEEIDGIFRRLINTSSKKGGTEFESFFFMLFISIFLARKKVLMKHTIDSSYVLKNADEAIGIIMKYHSHDCAFYKCNGISFYYDSSKSESLIQYDYKQLLTKCCEYGISKDRYNIFNVHFGDLDFDDIKDPTFSKIKGPFIYNYTRNELYVFINDEFKIIKTDEAITFFINNLECFLEFVEFRLLEEAKNFTCDEYKSYDVNSDEYLSLHYYFYNLFNSTIVYK